MVRDVTGDELGSGRVGVEAAGMRDAFVKQGVGGLVIARGTAADQPMQFGEPGHEHEGVPGDAEALHGEMIREFGSGEVLARDHGSDDRSSSFLDGASDAFLFELAFPTSCQSGPAQIEEPADVVGPAFRGVDPPQVVVAIELGERVEERPGCRVLLERTTMSGAKSLRCGPSGKIMTSTSTPGRTVQSRSQAGPSEKHHPLASSRIVPRIPIPSIVPPTWCSAFKPRPRSDRTEPAHEPCPSAWLQAWSCRSTSGSEPLWSVGRCDAPTPPGDGRLCHDIGV